jgi:hypothetical protein
VHTIVHKDGVASATLAELAAEGPTYLWRIMPRPGARAVQMLSAYGAFQAFILMAMPGKTFLGPITAGGNRPVYKARARWATRRLTAAVFLRAPKNAPKRARCPLPPKRASARAAPPLTRLRGATAGERHAVPGGHLRGLLRAAAVRARTTRARQPCICPRASAEQRVLTTVTAARVSRPAAPR